MSQSNGLSFEELIAYGMLDPADGAWRFGSLGELTSGSPVPAANDMDPVLSRLGDVYRDATLVYPPPAHSAVHGFAPLRPQYMGLDEAGAGHVAAPIAPPAASTRSAEAHANGSGRNSQMARRDAEAARPIVLASDTGSSNEDRRDSDDDTPQVAQWGAVFRPYTPSPHIPAPSAPRPVPAPGPSPQHLPPGGRQQLPPELQGPYMPQVPFPEARPAPQTEPSAKPDGGGNNGNDQGSYGDEDDEPRRDKHFVFRSAEDIKALVKFGKNISPQAQEMANYADEVSEVMRTNVLNGESPMRFLIKGYLLTRFSMQRGKVSTEHFKGKGLDIPPGMTHILPEDAMAAYMLSPSGKALLDVLEKGQSPTLEQVQHIVDVMRPFGRQNTVAEDIWNAVGLQHRKREFSELIRAGAHPVALEAFAKSLPGIGEGKSGYLRFYLGDGSKAAFDSRNRKSTMERVKWRTPADEPRFSRRETLQPSERIFPPYHHRLEQLNRPVLPWQKRNLPGIVAQEIWELYRDGDHHAPHPEDQRIRLRAMRKARLDRRLYGPAIQHPGSLPSDIASAVA